MVLTGRLPYVDCATNFLVLRRLQSMQLPTLPEDYEGWREPEKKMWGLYEKCCQFTSSKRPACVELEEYFQESLE